MSVGESVFSEIDNVVSIFKSQLEVYRQHDMSKIIPIIIEEFS